MLSYSITWSARTSSDWGIVKPSALAGHQRDWRVPAGARGGSETDGASRRFQNVTQAISGSWTLQSRVAQTYWGDWRSRSS